MGSVSSSSSSSTSPKVIMVISNQPQSKQPSSHYGRTDREGASTIAIISIFIFGLHMIAIALGLVGEIQSNLTEAQLYSLLFFSFVLVLLSFLFYLGIRYDSKSLILPWIVIVSLADIGYCAVVMDYFVILVTTPYRGTTLVAFLIATINFLVVTYVLWVIVRFFMDLYSSWDSRRPSSGHYEELNKGDDFEHLHRSHKPTIGSKLLPHEENDDSSSNSFLPRE